ncbi:hypothetical protein LZD49_28290 [Dyadobacter sp. CY261]|uniref:hypothetical protein n=1 Tax=Dyadobacter sp. CY261 TaxID=2907203 RepID=UPI001F378749|nr:hypothetical protein [Dyadobacter sp. CY261]MCF0074417.1 hypothetical protein [Dyadobacter sp. CY261]
MPRNKLSPIIYFVFLSFCAKAQIRFEKGYFISNDNLKTVCAIRNVDWDNNPTSFRYQLPGSDEVLEGTIRDTRAFGIENGYTYVRALANVDHSSTNLNRLSTRRNPEWNEELVFLKILVDGEVKLLQYKRSETNQFYYQKTDSTYIPLIYKRYIDGNGEMATNFAFRQQLLNDLSCSGITQLQIERTNYRESDLTRFFERYNACKNPQKKAAASHARRDAFNIKITPGADLTLLSTFNFTFTDDGKRSGNVASFRIGVEGEYFAPLHKNKWSVLAEPAFQYYKLPLWIPGIKLDVNFWTIELPVGIRHHFYLSDKTKIFINALYAWTLKEYAMDKENVNTDYRVIAGSNFAGGAGFAHGPFSVEARYYLNRSLHAYRARIDLDYSKLSVILGYRLFSR